MRETEAAYLAGIIDGEGTITLTRMHASENRRPIISIASTDIELLKFTKGLVGGVITSKKNYNPNKHRSSFVLQIKNKENVLTTLGLILPYLRVTSKINRATYIINNYDRVTIRNGRYTPEQLRLKKEFENHFFLL
ncbi:LAGLIDADG family homing endonuclease [Bacillus horti]|uniref:Homing endonuclease LAGLIDADG domain-containing protein n=1 Tax=Caldalkalibacillus horti TaxID=77523 RepID=A0ABT9W3A0_9BACI|nr:LAGLIDADG family homing endonuclease [Bacillus horti]MDQ0167722.1 hypothetical protein [Bacillus horti]